MYPVLEEWWAGQNAAKIQEKGEVTNFGLSENNMPDCRVNGNTDWLSEARDGYCDGATR